MTSRLDMAALLKQMEAPATSRRTRDVSESAPTAKSSSVDLSKNEFYTTIYNDRLTEADKIAAVRDALTTLAKKEATAITAEDLQVANAAMKAFEEYHVASQDKAIDTDLQSIREFIRRIKESVTPDMKKAIEKLTASDSKIHECRDLLEVSRIAEQMKTTIDKLKEAVQLEDRLQREIAEKNKVLASLNSETPAHDKMVSDAQAAVKEASGGIGGFVFGPSKAIKAQLASALEMQAGHNRAIAETTEAIEALEKQRNKDLYGDSGALKILREFDMVQDGFKDRITGAAQDTIDTIESVTETIKICLGRVGGSEVALKQIQATMDVERKNRTIVKAALNEAAKTNQAIADKIAEKVGVLETELAAATDDTVKGLTEVQLIDQRTNQSAMMELCERLNRRLTLVGVSDAAASESANLTAQESRSLQATKEGLEFQNSVTLPAVSKAMTLVLHQLADDQNREWLNASAEVTGALGKTAEGAAEHALRQQQAAHEEKIKSMKALIERLDTSSDALGRSIQQTVKNALEEGGVLRNMNESAEELQGRVEQAEQVRAAVRSHLKEARGEKEEEPTAPGAPVQPARAAMALVA